MNLLNPEFLITSLVVVLIPGTGVIYTISNGLFKGWKLSVAAAFGCTLGIVPHLTASVLGLSAILHMSAVAFQVIKYAGVAYLLYLAWSMWKDTGSLTFKNSDQRRDAWRIIYRGLLINILNPKLSIFFLAFLPQFMATESTVAPIFQLLGLSGVFMLMTFVVFVVYGAAAHGVSAYLVGSEKRTRWIQRSFASIFAVLGIKLALSEA